MRLDRLLPLVPAVAALVALSGCDKPIAIGDSSTLVAGVRESVWTELRDEIIDAMEPRIFTVRDERIFEVSHIDPTSADWADLKKVRNVLVIGEPDDPWVAEALSEADDAPTAPPAVAHARNVWAQNQRVTIVLLAPGTTPEEARPMIQEAGEVMVQRYENESRARMFSTGADSTTADSLRQAYGFSILAPRVYRMASPGEDIVVLRNDNPDPSRLIRQVHVTWEPAGTRTVTPEAARAWRAELAERLTQPPQETAAEIAQASQVTAEGMTGVEIHGIWSNPPGEWPSAGPYITRMLECGDRTYLVDAWLYAPGAAKYPYMIQLRTLLDSFRC